MAVTKVKFGQITVQMLLAAMLVDALHAALENAEIAFNGISVNVAANVFVCLVADALMARKMIAEREIMPSFVCHHRGFFRDIGLDDRDYICGAGSLDMERANLFALAVNK